MKIFLESPHTILRFKDGVRIYENMLGRRKRQNADYIRTEGGYKDIRIYLAGGVTGNLNPAWKRMAKTEITPNGFIKGLIDENFWRGGETRHWIQDVTSPTKEKGTDENISCGRSSVERGARQAI